MKEQFLPYELSLKLKELGFNERCIASYLNKSYSLDYIKNEVLYIDERFANSQDQIYNGEKIICLAPLWQQAFDWLRDKHNIHIVLYPKQMYPDNMVGVEYHSEIYYNDKVIEDDGVRSYYDSKKYTLIKALELIK